MILLEWEPITYWRWPMKNKLIIYPFLFAIFPVLFLYSYNIEELPFSVVFFPLTIVLSFTLVFISLLNFVIKDRDKTAMLAFLFIIVIFSYGHLLAMMQRFQLVDKTFSVHQQHIMLLLTLLGIYCAIAFLIIRLRKSMYQLGAFLNKVAFVLIIMSLFNIAQQQLSATKLPTEVDENKLQAVTYNPSNRYPDIYYLIFDRYAGGVTLKDAYDYDNSKFFNDLKSNGFYVAEKSVANYPVTFLSLFSSLNMKYLDKEKEVYKGAIVSEFDNFRAMRILKSKGYKFIYLGSGYEYLSRNKHADININYYFPDEFSMHIYQTTIFYPVFSKLFNFDRRTQKHTRVLYKFNKLAKLPRVDGPRFVFAHFQLPHTPYTFDEDGKMVSRSKIAAWGRKKAYREQIIFANKMIKEAIKDILANSDIPPVILIQSDEGPWPLTEILDARLHLQETTDFELREKMGILNAYYLPGIENNMLYPSISPVNSFRLVFNHYFDEKFELLPDRSYFNEGARLIDVTDRVKYE